MLGRKFFFCLFFVNLLSELLIGFFSHSRLFFRIMQENLYSWRGLVSEPKELPEPPILNNNYDLFTTNRTNSLKEKYAQVTGQIKENTQLSSTSLFLKTSPVGASEAQLKKPKTQKAATRKCTKCNNTNCSLRTCTSCSKEVCEAIRCRGCKNWFCNRHLFKCAVCSEKCCINCSDICRNCTTVGATARTVERLLCNECIAKTDTHC